MATLTQRVSVSANTLPGRPPRALEAYAWVVLGFMVLVILEGAVVRATSSGGGCGSHWPLCNGQVLPHHPRLATIIEFTHRSMTGVLSTMVIVLAGLVFWRTPRRHPARRAVVWVLALLVVEALLGALLVLGGYVERNLSNARVLVQSIHFTSTLSLVAALTLTAWWLGRPAVPQIPNAREVGNLQRARVLAIIALASAVITGAAGSVAALADTLFPAGSLHAALLQDFSRSAPLMVRMRWLHPAASLLAVATGFALSYMLVNKRTARSLRVLAILQPALGGLDVLLLAPVWLQVVHLLTADLFWIVLVIGAAECFRPGYAMAREHKEAAG